MKCPGQDTRYWKPGDIFDAECPACGGTVEFFKDEGTRRCKACGTKMTNPKMDFGCASYCQYASECLGEMVPELMAKRNDLLKDRVAVEVKRILGRDFQRIAHAARVARYVEEIAREEKAGPALVLCAAYLHALTETHGNENGTGRGEPRHILESLGAGPELVAGVVDLLDRLGQGNGGDSREAQLLLDAHKLATTEEMRDKEGR